MPSIAATELYEGSLGLHVRGNGSIFVVVEVLKVENESDNSFWVCDFLNDRWELPKSKEVDFLEDAPASSRGSTLHSVNFSVLSPYFQAPLPISIQKSFELRYVSHHLQVYSRWQCKLLDLMFFFKC
jgi:hypothetical protein